MGKKQYNSVADRRWQQRYQRIQERKDANCEIETSRDERRRQKRTLYRTSAINLDNLIPDRVAVICTTLQQIRQLFYAVNTRNSEYTRWQTIDGFEDRYYFCSNAGVCAIGIITEETWFGAETNLKLDSVPYFQGRGFEIIDFQELLPVIDLGKVRESPESVEFLLGI